MIVQAAVNMANYMAVSMVQLTQQIHSVVSVTFTGESLVKQTFFFYIVFISQTNLHAI